MQNTLHIWSKTKIKLQNSWNTILKLLKVLSKDVINNKSEYDKPYITGE